MRIIFDCPGCTAAANDEPGVPHTCEGSGAPVATAIHGAEEIETPLELPMHQVVIEFRVHGEGGYARRLADWFAEAALSHPEVSGPVTVAVTER